MRIFVLWIWLVIVAYTCGWMAIGSGNTAPRYEEAFARYLSHDPSFDTPDQLLTLLRTSQFGINASPETHIKLRQRLRMALTRQDTNAFGDDTSLLRFVSHNISYTDTRFVPDSLTKIDASFEAIRPHPAHKEIWVDSRIADDLRAMSYAFADALNEDLLINSGYRSYTKQSVIYDLRNPSDATSPQGERETNNQQTSSTSSIGRTIDHHDHYDASVAPAGTSEHQSGLAIDLWGFDITSMTTRAGVARYTRMSENAHRYGFTQSYQKGMAIDGYVVEPRHWRYVGRDVATLLHDHNLTFTQLYELAFSV